MSSKLLAFVNSTGSVELVLNTDESNVSIFTNPAHVVDITEFSISPAVGWAYDGVTFTAPNLVPENVQPKLTDEQKAELNNSPSSDN